MSAETSQAEAKRPTRSDRLLRVLADYAETIAVTHDNPDPDAIASGWAIVALVRAKLHKPARLVGSGAVVRAENRRLVELLQPPLELVDALDIRPDHAVVLVDCSPTAVNYLLANSSVSPVAVIDHHQHEEKRIRVRHRDIRTNVAASATIVTQYLREQAVEPSTDLATALLYAIDTDAIGWHAFSRSDTRVVSWLNERADRNKLADIQSAPLDRAYYADLLLAMETTFLYDRTAVCFLPQANGPEIVAEVADLLIRCREVDRVMCAAAAGGDVFVSIRTTADGGDAAKLVSRVLAGLGHGGGHRHRAGGKLPGCAGAGRVSEDLQAELRTRWLDSCGVDQQRGTRLVAPREIREHL